MREKSRQAVISKTADIMDVNEGTVAQVMNQHRVRRLIHGHTHRPRIHEYKLDTGTTVRAVLGDWHEHGSVLRVSPQACRLEAYD